MRLCGIFLSVFALISCARAPVKSVDRAMRLAKEMPQLVDDLPLSSLVEGLESNIKKLKDAPQTQMTFGPSRIASVEYIRALETLLEEAKQDPTGERLRTSLRLNFEPFEIYGRRKWGEVFMTSYYEPVIEGSKKPTKRNRRALYGAPKDLVDIDLGTFVAARPGLARLFDLATEQRSHGQLLRGRLLVAKDGANSRVVAYPARTELLVSDALKGQALELAWVDPVDGFLLEIQGSGVVRFEDGSELPIGYAAQNGHSYVAIGKHLLGVIPKEKMSIQAIEAHLRSVSEAEAQRIMNLNPSFVFFRPLTRRGVTFFGTELVDGRTIATDQIFFPKGALAFLEFERPVFEKPSDFEPSAWKKTSRFVLDQDTGGAIRGPDRVDLFWGRGTEAKQSAGVMKNFGRLVYFVPKREFLRQIMTAD